MQKILFFSLLFLASSIKPMDQLTSTDKAAVQNHIRAICYALGHVGSTTFAGAKTQNTFVASQAKELESILNKNNIEVPTEKNFDWLESLRKKLAPNGE